jgi:type IV secretory pathway VirB2 component (pilin)
MMSRYVSLILDPIDHQVLACLSLLGPITHSLALVLVIAVTCYSSMVYRLDLDPWVLVFSPSA